MNAFGVGNTRPDNLDGWDAYQGQRNRILSNIYDHQIDNVVFFTGEEAKPTKEPDPLIFYRRLSRQLAVRGLT